VLLRDLLGSMGGDSLSALARAFFAGTCELIETPWSSSALPDFAMPQTEGERPADLEDQMKIAGALGRLAAGRP
jgi:hypothetical protein